MRKHVLAGALAAAVAARGAGLAFLPAAAGRLRCRRWPPRHRGGTVLPPHDQARTSRVDRMVGIGLVVWRRPGRAPDRRQPAHRHPGCGDPLHAHRAVALADAR